MVWNDRIDLMVLVQEALTAKHEVLWSLLVDTLIAKGYHRCDKDERKKMDDVDRKADEVATMRLRSRVLHEVWDHFIALGLEHPEDSDERAHYFDLALMMNSVTAEYAGLRARVESRNGLST